MSSPRARTHGAPHLFLFIGALIAPFAGCGDDAPLPLLPDASVGCDAGGASCGGCTSDGQCGAATPRCDRNTGRCVRCLPTADNCPAGQRCLAVNGDYQCAGTCLGDSDCPRTDGGVPLSCCAGACLDTTTNTDHCGGCGKLCPTPANARAACVAGGCGLGPCTTGFANCDGAPESGCEVDLRGDVRNCGACGTTCAGGPNQTTSCMAGACSAPCSPGFLHCSMNPADGCEIDGASDVKNCGACGRPCAGLPHASSACMAGVCSVVNCTGGFTDCNKRPDDGCETDLTADPLNCGVCGVACPAVPNGDAGCQGRTCGVGACNKGFGDCDGQPANGCETAIGDDPKNCGACGVVCAGANSTQTCKGGKCLLAACAPGFSDCDGLAANGCESATSNDPNNCGGCGQPCTAVANGIVGCANSMCTFGGCKFGFGDCNNDLKDGCEADLLGPQNCGKCGNACQPLPNANPGCNLAMCGVGACKPGFGDCNKMAADGCEKPVDSDINNCGACGRVCVLPNAVAGCLNSQCGVLGCNPGRGDCDGMAGNGCETVTDGDLKNCGKCGNVCPNGMQCSSGQCVNLYAPVGPQTNVAIGGLTGWSQCFLDLYGDGNTPSLAQIVAMCPKAKLMLACRLTGAASLQVLAWAPRADVFFDVGNAYNSNISHSANGSAWYFGNSSSWGFAKDGDPVNRGTCDTRASSLDATGGNGNLRLCWHTSNDKLNGGWRCGTADTLNASVLYERLIYQAD